ncbi:MAG: AAA family ATPase [Flavobacteriales bacterium]|jgi:DNA repair protein RecN (Recombination protein N)|nr:AAA family ATPase [Flavobacteriales bacterium]
MLKEIKINNYALIDSIEMSFNSGMTSITGETGAGKSILLGGLSLVLGSRVDNSKIINKQTKCFVEATFDINEYDLKSFFDLNSLDYEKETILRREVIPSGKSRAFINDTPVNLDVLSKLGNTLIDVHSQHNNLTLLDNNFKYIILDSLSNNEKLVVDYNKEFGALKEIEIEIEKIEKNKLNLDKQSDYNNYLLKEFEGLKLEDLNLNNLKEQVKELDNIEETLTISANIINEINNDEIGVNDKLSFYVREINKISENSSKLKSFKNKFIEIKNDLIDLTNDYESYINNLESKDTESNVFKESLDLIYSLQNKHRVNSIEELINIKNDLLKKIDDHENFDKKIMKLKLKRDNIIKSLNKVADRLHQGRKKAIPIFIEKMNNNFMDLGMENSKIKIEISKSKELQKNGNSLIEFLFKGNKGTNYNELKNIASRGEVSRIMLSIKSILSKYKKLSAIIFDEIDTGVSGIVSSKVANLMYNMSRNMQVLTITHLPQVASKGDNHFKVFKYEDQNRTITDIKLLNKSERINEIAEMLSGKKLNKSAKELANQLLN